VDQIKREVKEGEFLNIPVEYLLTIVGEWAKDA
jgi:hypothetical protein